MKKILIWLTIATLLFTGFALAERSTENDQSTDNMPEEEEVVEIPMISGVISEINDAQYDENGKLVFDEYIYAYRFAVATGVRPGELVGLWYGDVKGNTVNLRRSINRLDEETTGKNENAIRSFDMGEEAHEAYEAQVALLKASDIPLNYTTPLFQIPNQRALFKRWKKYQRDNGIEPQVTLYEMRHTFVSIESGVLTDSQLKMLVGHSKNMDTAGVYRHELDGQREDLAAATTAAFRKAQG